MFHILVAKCYDSNTTCKMKFNFFEPILVGIRNFSKFHEIFSNPNLKRTFEKVCTKLLKYANFR